MKKVHMKVLRAACATLLVLLIWTVPRIDHLGTKKKEADSAGPNIFFLETSGRRYLTLREACVVESAARAHPRSDVTLLSSTLEPLAVWNVEGGGRMPVGPHLMPNVIPAVLDARDILEGTPLERWYASGKLKRSLYREVHLSDALRLALLWKRGGVYLDLDAVVLRSLGRLRDALGLEAPQSAANAILAFDRGSRFLESCMREYVKGFMPLRYAQQGPLLVTRVLRETCGGGNLSEFVGKPQECGGVTLLPEASFYPLRYQNWEDLFEEVDRVEGVQRMRDDSYTVHLWAIHSRPRSAKVGGGSAIDSLAKEYCPSTYRYIGAQSEF